MAGMRLPRRAGTPLQDGQEQFNPFTRETSNYSKAAGGMVSPTMAGMLATGRATADPANNRIVGVGGDDGMYMGPDGLNYMRGTGPAAKSSGGAGGPDTAAMQALINEIRGGPKAYTPEQTPIVRSGSESMPYEMAAERSAFGAAKERVGSSMQSALRSLREQMSRRGLGGSGIEASEMGKLYRGGLGELAAADRDMVGQRAGRAFQAEQANTDREINQRQTNAGAVNTARQHESSDWLARMGLIAQLTRQLY